MGFPDGSVDKELACNAGDMGSIFGLGRSPGGGRGNPFQYSCLGNSTSRRAWQATFYGVAKSQIGLKRLSTLINIMVTKNTNPYSPPQKRKESKCNSKYIQQTRGTRAKEEQGKEQRKKKE